MTPHPRTVVCAMSGALVALAFALDRVRIPPDSLAAAALRSEPTHLAAHTLLYGALAASLAAWWLPRETGDEGRMSLGRRALCAALCFAAVASAQELTQALCRRELPAGEELFDLAVDATGATLGLIAWSRADGLRAARVAKALGLLLHPGIVAPLGVFALTWAAQRSVHAGVTWSALATLAALPVAAVWRVGLRRGWFRDADLSVRAERPRFLATACVMSLALALATRAAGAPAAVRELSLAGLIATLLVTGITLGGLKVSGHVAVPAGVTAMLVQYSPRGVWPFAVAAVALSWARVREGRHTAREVLGAWGVAGASALLVRA